MLRHAYRLPCTTVRSVAKGVYGVYTLPKSVQVNFLWGNNVVRTVIEHEY